MGDIIINVSDTIPPSNLATIDKDGMVGNTYSKEQFDDKFEEKSLEIDDKLTEIEELVESQFRGMLLPTDPTPTEDGSYKPEISSKDNILVDPNDYGTLYANAGNYRAKDGYSTIFYKKGAVWKKSETKMPESSNKFDTWIATTYLAGKQVINSSDQSVYEANTDTTAGDVPGVSAKWDKKLSNDPVKVAFTNVIKFDKKKKQSTIYQSGNIDFTYDSSGLFKDAMYKIDVISDGVSDINFTGFEVVGEADKTKNQTIYFSIESLVEFKPLAVVLNIGKSGQTTPINLDADAQLYYNDILATGSTISTAETNAMNNLFLAMKANGYYPKVKGLYLALGNNTTSRCLNAIPGRPDATLISGTVTADGIVGVLDSGMKPSEIFSLSSFAYGIHNTTATYNNSQSMGCGVSSTSGILLICTALSPSGQFLFSGPNRDVYANASNADSLGTYVVTRTGAALAKLFKNGTLLFTHSVSQGSATLPAINFAIGGYNNNGVFVDDARTTKWAFLADGLTDIEAVNIVNDLNTLMAAIGR